MLTSVGGIGSGQTTSPTQMPSSAPPSSSAPGDDITRREIAQMDQFLDSHPEIGEQLRKDPSLIDNRKWVADHPALRDYLQDHPRVSEAFRTNPNLFMRDENRYERTEGDRDHDINRRDVAEMDRFLDSHPEIAEQLHKDPSLIDNRQWVQNHPALQDYLRDHPQMSAAFRSDPNLFMRDENRYERTEGDRDHDINRRDVAEMDRFLDSHPEIAEQLHKDPSLIENRQWVTNHPALQDYLRDHPQMSAAFRSDPTLFMRDENRYERTEGDRDHDNRMGIGDRDDRNRAEFTSFGQFLGGHSVVAAELSSDPTLANNKEYLAGHPELDEYLKAHPAMSQQLADNPQAVMSSNWVQQSGGVSAKPLAPTPKPKSSPNR